MLYLLIQAHQPEVLDSLFQLKQLGRAITSWLVGQLAGPKRWPTLNEVEMPCYIVDEGIRRLKEIAMLEYIYPVRPALQPWKDTTFATAVKNKF